MRRHALRAASLALLLATPTLLAQIAIPPHQRVYNGFSRGFNFTANIDFVITDLGLPLDAFQVGDTAGYLIRINGVETLRSVGNTGNITTSIFVNTGDVVDVIANWSPASTGNFTAHNSYGAGMFNTTIEGVPHVLQRCGWQWDIADPNYTNAAYLNPTTGQLGRVLVWTSLPAGFATGTPYGAACGSPPLELTSVARPVIGQTGTTETRNIPAGAIAGVHLYGLSPTPPPGIDLSVIGLPGCFLHTTNEASVPFAVNATTAQHSLQIPNNSALAGAHLYSQSICVAPSVNALGVILSNGMDWRFDVR